MNLSTKPLELHKNSVCLNVVQALLDLDSCKGRNVYVTNINEGLCIEVTMKFLSGPCIPELMWKGTVEVARSRIEHRFPGSPIHFLIMAGKNYVKDIDEFIKSDTFAGHKSFRTIRPSKLVDDNEDRYSEFFYHRLAKAFGVEDEDVTRDVKASDRLRSILTS
jgi:hypothetical protein